MTLLPVELGHRLHTDQLEILHHLLFILLELRFCLLFLQAGFCHNLKVLSADSAQHRLVV